MRPRRGRTTHAVDPVGSRIALHEAHPVGAQGAPSHGAPNRYTGSCRAAYSAPDPSCAGPSGMVPTRSHVSTRQTRLSRATTGAKPAARRSAAIVEAR